MAKAVFMTKIRPTYDDLPESRYHFPKKYLSKAQEAVGDWIVYYEPRRSSGELSSRGGRQAYFAIARLVKIEADPSLADHYYAYVDNYLEFDNPVPFQEGKFYYESALKKEDGSTNKGAFQQSVRLIQNHEYELILRAGFVKTIDQLDDEQVSFNNQSQIYMVAEPEMEERRIIQRMVARPFRQAAFSVSVEAAYGDTCAISGLRIINGGGRSEVQAAHIRPVAAQGPDSIRNGIALSGTVHWMFDRGLLSIDNDGETILIAEGRLPDVALRLINKDRKLLLPAQAECRPHRQYVDFHRLNVFKG